MRALWQALSLLAKEDNFRANVKAVSDVEIREDQPTEPVDLRPQPTFQALQEIDRLFTNHKPQPLYLSAYELGEINRWVRYGKGVEPVAKVWEILNEAAPATGVNLDSPSEDFMAAIGAMAIDSELRFRAWYEETNKRNRLSQAAALLAEDTKFKKDVKDVKETAEPGADQPKALQDLETLFRGKNLCLSAHELSEIKIWVRDDPSAVGAESFIRWYEQRASQDGSNPILRNHGFKLSRDEEVVLTELYPGGPADNLCKQFFLDIWGGYPCTSLTIVYPGWVHSNA